MTKRELAEKIAEAYFPPHYTKDCGAKRGFIEQKMAHNNKAQLEELATMADEVLKQRINA